jgi:hypothetical protein
VTVLTLAKTRDAPLCHTRTVPERSAQNSLPSGANARAVAKLAAMVPLGAGSFDGVVHALGIGVLGGAVGVGVGVTTAVALRVAVGLGVDPHPAMTIVAPASAAHRRTPIDRSADSGSGLLLDFSRGDLAEMLACPAIDGVDHPLQVDAC